MHAVQLAENGEVLNTICMHADSLDSCPITTIKFVNKDSMPSTKKSKYETFYWNANKHGDLSKTK